MNPLSKWITEGLQREGKTKGGLAKALGRYPSAVSLLLKGGRRIKAEEVGIISAYLGVPPPPAVLNMAADGVKDDPPPPLDELPVCGVVEAGAWREVAKPAGRAKEPAPRDGRFPDAKQYLLRVSGDSMNASDPPIREGALVRCVNFYESGVNLRSGLLVVVERRDGGSQLVETTVKRVKVFRDRYELHPESTNPAHKTIVVKNGDGDDGVEVSVTGLVTGVFYENLGF